MKFVISSLFAASALPALCAHAYLATEEGAFNVRHIHMVERGAGGEIVGRAFANTYDIKFDRDAEQLDTRGVGKGCTTIMACGTPGGCALMAAQTYCKDKSPQQSFQEAVKQIGANGMASLRLIGESIGRGGPVGMIAGAVKATTKAALADSKKRRRVGKGTGAKKGGSKPKKGPRKKASKKSSPKKKAPPKKEASPKKPAHKTKRDLESEAILEVTNKRDFEVVERDADMHFVRRSEYTIFIVVSRGEGRSIVSRACETYNGDASCM